MVILEASVTDMLRGFMVRFKQQVGIKGVSSYFIIDDFGVVICCMNRIDYTQVSDKVTEQFKGWRFVYLTSGDNNIVESKYKVLWALMRGGYMKWLRYNYPRQIKNVLNGTDNLAKKIIDERLRLWADKPKYKFFIDDNKAALRGNISRELTSDPSFFDYLPEEE